jgi:HK97 gp10 family phage protein
VTAVEIKGLDALRQRFEAAADPRRFKEAVRAEAEAIAAEARREAPGELGQSIEVKDASQGTTLAYTISTPDPLGRILEFGTLRRPASPWLWPIFRARLPAIKDRLRKVAVVRQR